MPDVFVFLPEHQLRPNLYKAVSLYLDSNSKDYLTLTNPKDIKALMSKKSFIPVPAVYISKKSFLDYLNLSKDIIEGSLKDIKKAIELAQKIHKNHKRKNGDTYFNGHILPVALQLLLEKLLRGKKIKSNTLAVALLHDILEDGNREEALKSLKAKFNSAIIESVLTLTKVDTKGLADLPEYKFLSIEKAKKLETTKYLKKISKNPICLKVKCVDRVLNLFSDIENKNRDTAFVKDYLNETEYYFYPMFKRVGGSCLILLNLAVNIIKELVLV